MDEHGVPYSQYLVTALKDKLRLRGLCTTGLKADMINRLEACDKKHQQTQTPPPPPLPPRAISPPGYRERDSYRPNRPEYQGQSHARDFDSDQDRDPHWERDLYHRGRQGRDDRWQTQDSDNDHDQGRGRSWEFDRQPDRDGRRKPFRGDFERQRERYNRSFSPPSKHNRPSHRMPDRESSQFSRTSSSTEQSQEEAELKAICRHNWCDPSEKWRDSDYETASDAVKSNFTVKADALEAKRKAAIEEIKQQYRKDIKELEKGRDSGFEEVENEFAPLLEKRKKFGEAFRRLKDLRAARGLSTFTNYYAPEVNGSLANTSAVATKSNAIPLPGVSKPATTTTSTHKTSPSLGSWRRKPSGLVPEASPEKAQAAPATPATSSKSTILKTPAKTPSNPTFQLLQPRTLKVTTSGSPTQPQGKAPSTSNSTDKDSNVIPPSNPTLRNRKGSSISTTLAQPARTQTTPKIASNTINIPSTPKTPLPSKRTPNQNNPNDLPAKRQAVATPTPKAANTTTTKTPTSERKPTPISRPAKRKASPSPLIDPKTKILNNKRAKETINSILTLSSPIPSRSRGDVPRTVGICVVEQSPIGQTISRTTPYIIVPVLKITRDDLRDFRDMLAENRFTFETARADKNGYYITFEDSEKGREDMRLCLRGLKVKKTFHGKSMMSAERFNV